MLVVGYVDDSGLWLIWWVGGLGRQVSGWVGCLNWWVCDYLGMHACRQAGILTSMQVAFLRKFRSM